MKTRCLVRSLVAAATLVVAAHPAFAANVILYETSETIAGIVRTAPLLGTATIASPFCLVVSFIDATRTHCIVTGAGTADLATGEVGGTLAVVVEGSDVSAINTNPFDVAEVAVTVATLQDSTITPRPSLPGGTPKGLGQKLAALGFPVLLDISGTIAFDYLNADACAAVGGCPLVLPFAGTFRLPFGFAGGSSSSNDGPAERPRRDKPAFYLSDAGKLIAVKQNERAIGFATPRLEVTVPVVP